MEYQPAENSIPERPHLPFDPELSRKVLSCAASYLSHADQLIYSYGSKTFLNGYDVYDAEREHRGNIDCSTFVLLVLSGISYEKSPYGKGSVAAADFAPASWADAALYDFSMIPDHYESLASRIGRPYLEGPKGLDLKKLEELQIPVETLAEEFRALGFVRKSTYLARYFMDRNACFQDPACAAPGDIVFFRSKGFYEEDGRRYEARKEITHVGILAEDPAYMIHSSGTWKKEALENEALPAVAQTPVLVRGEPAFFGRYTGGEKID